MVPHIVVVDRPEDIPAIPAAAGRQVLTARAFIDSPPPADAARSGRAGMRVINLTRDHRYLSLGYYVSLLAEGRGERVIPTPSALTEISSKRIYAHALPELTGIARRHLMPPPAGGAITRTVTVMFGETAEPETAALGRRAFDLFRLPLMALHLVHGAAEPVGGGLGWSVRSVRSRGVRGLDSEDHAAFARAIDRFTTDRWRAPKPAPRTRHDLAILHDPADPLPPSNSKALARFCRLGPALGLDVTLITRRDLARLAEFNALFIRETTRIDHHTFRFATRAAQEDMPVIDDPQSIVRCTNKIYLAELLRVHNLPAPKTMILHRERLLDAEAVLGYPMVLKIPDGAFSNGVFKAENRDQLIEMAARVFARSDLALAQAFVYTAFDWRVGILNRQPIFACQYFMSRDHWQIVKHSGDGRIDQGGFRTMAVEAAPAEVIDAAVRAAAPIGDGLYGVDLKQNADGVFVIEVNDNPNIDAGVEDAVLKDDLYRIILKDFVRRIEAR
ncbi:RimK family protein [Tistrella bauzanensis]|uniref:RimK family protein n=1 Tax=Tistrella TaxID=171436 RepID=UPI0031F6A2AF